MNKNTVISLLKNQQVSQEDFVKFIIDYIKVTKNKDVTSEQLEGILRLIELRIFDLDFALKNAAKILNLQIVSLYNKNNILRIDIYEGT